MNGFSALIHRMVGCFQHELDVAPDRAAPDKVLLDEGNHSGITMTLPNRYGCSRQPRWIKATGMLLSSTG